MRIRNVGELVDQLLKYSRSTPIVLTATRVEAPQAELVLELDEIRSASPAPGIDLRCGELIELDYSDDDDEITEPVEG